MAEQPQLHATERPSHTLNFKAKEACSAPGGWASALRMGDLGKDMVCPEVGCAAEN